MLLKNKGTRIFSCHYKSVKKIRIALFMRRREYYKTEFLVGD
jgi:hypothetical protein